MQNKWFFYLGYVRVSFRKTELKLVLDLFHKEGIVARFLSDESVDVPIFFWKKAKKKLEDKVVFTEQKTGGIYALLPLMRRHIGVSISVPIALLFYLWISFFVFDVRIEGNEFLSKEKIAEELSVVGLYPGVRWNSLDYSEIENNLLTKAENISWVNIHRRGLVAYVTVKEKASVPQTEQKNGYANIVSEYDGVIEEITVRAGEPSVLVGQTVKKGELLISAFDAEGHPVYAEGEVYARVYGSFSVFIPRHDKEIIKEERVLLKKIVKIFNFSINIFKNYGNLPEEYVIIEDKRRIMLSENKPLPITLTSSFAIVGQTREVVRSDEELLVLAKQAHESAVLSYLSSAEIVFIQTQGEFVDDGYIMKSEICMLTQIGITIPVPIA